MNSPSLSQVFSFLTMLYEKNLKYRTINIFRSALSSTLLPVDGIVVGQHPLVCQLMKAIFNLRPPIKKFVLSWSIATMLQTIRQ